MLTQPLQSKFTIRDGHEVIIESGRLARQADGSVTVRQGNCMILATVVPTKNPEKGKVFSHCRLTIRKNLLLQAVFPVRFLKEKQN